MLNPGLLSFKRNFSAKILNIIARVNRKAQITFKSQLEAKIIYLDGKIEDKGVISQRVITTTGVNYLVDSFQNSVANPMSNFKFHGSGTGTNGEVVGDTALQTEVGSRATGTQEEGTSANIYKTVATITYSSTFAITEWGIFSASSVGTLWDRAVFSALNVTSGVSIQFTYQLTVNAGG